VSTKLDRRVVDRRGDERRTSQRSRHRLTGAALAEEFRLAAWVGAMAGYEIVAAR
jgi:hypothetical protein